MGNLASWVHASATVYSAESFDPRATLDALETEKCTGVHGVPTHFLGLMEALKEGKLSGKEWDLSTLRFANCLLADAHMLRFQKNRDCCWNDGTHGTDEAINHRAQSDRADQRLWDEYVTFYT